jgi:hypothetical protein
MASVYNLERMVHKGVRTKDGTDLGNIIATDEANITVQGRRIYKIPAQLIDLYNGSEVFLNISSDELPKYKIF